MPADARREDAATKLAARQDVARGPFSGESETMSDIEELGRMIDDLRRQREACEPKSNTNPRYLRYSNAISALKWIIEDLHTERSG